MHSFLKSILYGSAVKARIEKALIEELSSAIHCEDNFSFLRVIPLADRYEGKRLKEIWLRIFPGLKNSAE